MLTMGTVATSSRCGGIWEIEYIYKPKIIARQHNISRPINIINVSFIFTLGLQTMTVITIFHSVCGPYMILSSLMPMCITLLFSYIIIKNFVIPRWSSDSQAVSTPINRINPSMISMILSIESVLVRIWVDFIDIKMVIVRPNSEEVFTWWVFCNFAPLFSWFKYLNFLVKVIKWSNWYFTQVAANNKMRVLLRHSDCSCLLVWWHLACSCSSRLFGWILHFFFVWNFSASNVLLSLCVKKHNSIVITTSDNLIIFSQVEAPYFTFKVRLHDYLRFLWLSINCTFNLYNSTISKTNK